MTNHLNTKNESIVQSNRSITALRVELRMLLLLLLLLFLLFVLLLLLLLLVLCFRRIFRSSFRRGFQSVLGANAPCPCRYRTPSPPFPPLAALAPRCSRWNGDCGHCYVLLQQQQAASSKQQQAASTSSSGTGTRAHLSAVDARNASHALDVGFRSRVVRVPHHAAIKTPANSTRQTPRLHTYTRARTPRHTAHARLISRNKTPTKKYVHIMKKSTPQMPWCGTAWGSPTSGCR